MTPAYTGVPGLCKAATIAEIIAQGWSLNLGRYVGLASGEDVSDEDLKAQLGSLNNDWETLNEVGEGFKTRLKMNGWSMAATQNRGRLQSISVIGSMETPQGDISVGSELVHDSQADAILSNALRVAEGVLR